MKAAPGFANFIAQIATVISVFVAAWAIYSSARSSHKQSQLSTFVTYAQRYEQIMSEFSEYGIRFDLGIWPPENNQVRLAALRYLNLISEEYYLQSKGYIDKEIWKMWEPEINRFLRSPLMEREWGKLEDEFKSSQEFSNFVKKAQNSSSRLSR